MKNITLASKYTEKHYNYVLTVSSENDVLNSLNLNGDYSIIGFFNGYPVYSNRTVYFSLFNFIYRSGNW
jgi:hypothetical protein